MAGPVNGLGTGAQVPLANTFQPGQNSVRPEDDKKQQDNQVRTRGTEPTGVHKSDTGNTDAARSTRTASNDDSKSSSGKSRGSVVDITV